MSTPSLEHLTVLMFAKHLPGIDRDAFRSMFSNPFEMFFVADSPGIRVLDRKRRGQTLAMTEVPHERKRVDARAATAIVHLYSVGALPMLKGKCPDAEAYVSEAAIAEREAKEAAKQVVAMRNGYIGDPARVWER